MQSFYLFMVGALAVWRITHLLNTEDGPWDMFVVLRRAVGNGFLGRMFDCFYCLSLWVAAPVAFLAGSSWREWILVWPALSGLAILLERATSPPPSPPVAYFEEQQKGD